jgi:hypothetical protein
MQPDAARCSQMQPDAARCRMMGMIFPDTGNARKMMPDSQASQQARESRQTKFRKFAAEIHFRLLRLFVSGSIHEAIQAMVSLRRSEKKP